MDDIRDEDAQDKFIELKNSLTNSVVVKALQVFSMGTLLVISLKK